MFVNVGTITASSKEAELAAVMAHEMSHVYMQHSAKQAGKAQKTEEIAVIAGAILGPTQKREPIGSLAQEGIDRQRSRPGSSAFSTSDLLRAG